MTSIKSPAFLAYLSILVILFGCAAPAKMSADRPPKLRQQLDAILADSALTRSTAGVKVVSLKTGEVLYDHNSQLLFHPASNQKLLTSAAAISLLGSAFEFVTVAACDSGARQDTVILGDLYLIGRGDPDLTTKDLFELAQSLYRRGIREIQGNLVCDDFYFDQVRWASGWMWDDEPSPLWSRFTALSLNDNAIVVTASPGLRAGDPASVVMEPENDYVSISNTATTVLSKAVRDSLALPPLRLDRRWQQNENVYTVEGAIGMDESPRSETMNVLEPQLLAGHVFKRLLQHAGIRVAGEVQHGQCSAAVEKLAEFRRPLQQVLVNLNKISDNLSAEQIFKTVAAERYGPPGTGENGTRALREFLGSVGVDTLAVRIADGSGVSRYNLISPAEIVNLLTAMWRNFKLRNEFIATLPIAGVDGTLDSRMQGTLAEGVVHAKTGTLSGVSTLAGYTTTADGEEVVLSIMIQHFIGSASGVRRVQDRICQTLCEWRKELRSGAE